MAIVYAHRKKTDNTVFYIGIGNSYKRAQRCANRNTHWSRVYNKYGRTIELIESDVSIEQAKELEIFLIDLIGLPNLCNQTLGGEGAFGLKHTKESREKMSKANKGKKKSDESIKKMMETKRKNGTFKHSQETKDKISKANKGNPKIIKAVRGRTHTQEAKDKVSRKNKGRKPTPYTLDLATKKRREKGKKVIELTTGNEYFLWDIKNKLGIDRMTVVRSITRDSPILKGRFKGLKFKYLQTP